MNLFLTCHQTVTHVHRSSRSKILNLFEWFCCWSGFRQCFLSQLTLDIYQVFRYNTTTCRISDSWIITQQADCKIISWAKRYHSIDKLRYRYSQVNREICTSSWTQVSPALIAEPIIEAIKIAAASVENIFIFCIKKDVMLVVWLEIHYVPRILGDILLYLIQVISLHHTQRLKIIQPH